MDERRRRQRVVRVTGGMMIVSFLAFVPALVLRNLPLMLVALILPAVAGVGLFSMILRGRRPG